MPQATVKVSLDDVFDAIREHAKLKGYSEPELGVTAYRLAMLEITMRAIVREVPAGRTIDQILASELDYHKSHIQVLKALDV